MRCTKTYDKENKKPVVHQYLFRVKDWLCLIDAHIVGELFSFFIIVSLWYNRNIKIGSYKGETLWDYLVKAKKSEKKSI